MRFQQLSLLPLVDDRHLYSWEGWCRLVRQGFVGTVWNDGGGWYSNDPCFLKAVVQALRGQTPKGVGDA